VQHRGGPPGFIKVLDPHTLAFADFLGNRQYITLGNLAENDRAFLFLMNYEERERIKIWGRARVVTGDRELFARLADPNYDARVEQAIVFDVLAWDSNCPQHIPRLIHAEAAERTIATLEQRVDYLEAALREAGIAFRPQ
jgi:predicted pyridoxine 5'-phosphate oxidase superfamily flavin-nucleotide-binding protein